MFLDVNRLISAFASLGDALVSGDNIIQSLGTALLGTLGGILVQLEKWR